MRTQMLLRTLYTRSREAPDTDHAKWTVDQWIDSADPEELLEIATRDILYDNDFDDIEDEADKLHEIRRELKGAIREKLDDLYSSLHQSTDDKDVVCETYADEYGTQTYVYMTGGVSSEMYDRSYEDPTDSYTTWEIVIPDGIYLPREWQLAIRTACGFIDPNRVHMVIAADR